MTAGDPGGVVVEADPIPKAGRSTEEDLEATVGIEVELGVVDHTGGPLRKGAVRAACLDGEGHIDRSGRTAGDAIGELWIDGGVEVERVRVVTEALAGRRHDLPEDRLAGIVLEVADQAALEQVGQGPESSRDVIGRLEAPLGPAEPIGNLLQGADQLIERLTGLGLAIAHLLNLSQ